MMTPAIQGLVDELAGWDHTHGFPRPLSLEEANLLLDGSDAWVAMVEPDAAQLWLAAALLRTMEDD